MRSRKLHSGLDDVPASKHTKPTTNHVAATSTQLPRRDTDVTLVALPEDTDVEKQPTITGQTSFTEAKARDRSRPTTMLRPQTPNNNTAALPDLSSISHSEKYMKGLELLKAIEDDCTDRTDILMPLLEDNASVEEKDAVKQRTPLLVAAMSNKPRTVEMLLQHGADITAIDSMEKTALHLACENAGLDVVSSLLRDRGQGKESSHYSVIDVNAIDSNGRTALHYCAERDMVDAAEALVQCKADVNIQDKGQHYPTYFAVRNRKYATLKLLLERGALVDSRDCGLNTSNAITRLIRQFPNNRIVRRVSAAEGLRRTRTDIFTINNSMFSAHGRRNSAMT